MRIFVGVVTALWMSQAVAGPKAAIQTSMGKVVVELDEAKAPITVKNFVSYANSKFFDGTVFHRVIKDFMIQGGGFSASFDRKETKAPIKNEAANGLKNERGTIAMARTSDPNSATAQFFINTKTNDFLNYSPKSPGYAVFGKVVEGMDIVDKIQNVKTSIKNGMRDVPVENVKILSVTIDAAAPAKDKKKEEKKSASTK